MKIFDEQNWVIKDRSATIILRNVTYYSVLCGFLDSLCGSSFEHGTGHLGSIKEGKFSGKISCYQLPMNDFTR